MSPEDLLSKVKVLEDIIAAAPALIADAQTGEVAFQEKDPAAAAAAVSKFLTDLGPALADLKATAVVVAAAPTVTATPTQGQGGGVVAH